MQLWVSKGSERVNDKDMEDGLFLKEKVTRLRDNVEVNLKRFDDSLLLVKYFRIVKVEGEIFYV